MIYVNSVMNAIYTILSSDQTLVDSGVSVDLNELYNLDPNRMPWVGIYNGEVNIEPHRANITNPWLAVYNPTIYVQDQQLNFNGEETSNSLDKLLTPVLTAINSNRTLNQTVDMIRGIDISPFQLDIEEDNSIFGYELVINAEVKA